MQKDDVILFDLDGTLTDSGPGIMNAAAYAMERFGLPCGDTALLRKFVGPPLRDSFRDFCGLSDEKAVEAIGVFREYYEPKGVFENSVYPGVPEMLETLLSAGRRLAVATSKLEPTALRVLEHFGLAGYFELAAGSLADNTRTRKAEVVAYTLGRLGVTDKSRALMVGDREHDVIGARENGLDCLGVLYGYGSAAELRAAGALCLAETPQRAAELILQA